MMDEPDETEDEDVVVVINKQEYDYCYNYLRKYFDEKITDKLLKERSTEYLQEKFKQLEYLLQFGKTKPRNPSGFLYKSIIDNYRDDEYKNHIAKKNADSRQIMDFNREIDKFVDEYSKLTGETFKDSEEVRQDMKNIMFEVNRFGYLEFLIVAFKDFGRKTDFWEFIGLKPKEFNIYALFKNVEAVKRIIDYVVKSQKSIADEFRKRIRDPVTV